MPAPRLLAALAVTLLLATAAQAQRPVISKIDPPNWWAAMPKPMLLLNGENFTGATFTLSDRTLRIEKTDISANGHWAQLWLAASPAQPETTRISAKAADGASATASYTFAARRAATDGFAGFSSKDVMYLIMTDRFADGDPGNDGPDAPAQKKLIRGWHGGDLRGITQHLDYLQTLGITTVWITPVYQNHQAESYHGYGATDMYAVDEHYGTLADLKALSSALHQRGMKLVLDTVPNHVGQQHPWVKDSPTPDWFHGTLASHTEAQGDFKALLDPHAPWRDQKDVLQGWFANTLPDMNQENPAAAQYLTQNAIWWTEEAGLDGLRIDTFPYVGRAFWHSFHDQLHGLYPHLTTVGEIFNPDPTITSAFAGGVTRDGLADTGLDTPFDFPTYSALRQTLLKNAPLSQLAEVLRQDALYPHPERLVPFFGNHDTTRFLGEPGATDTQLRLAFAILFTMRGMPQVYSGDEIAMTGGEDPDNRRDFPGGFLTNASGAGPNAFISTGRTPQQAAMYTWVKQLLDLRRSHPALTTGAEQLLQSGPDTLVYVRGAGLGHGCSASSSESRILIAINRADHPITLTVPTENTALTGCTSTQALLGPMEAIQLQPTQIQLILPPLEPLILSLNPGSAR